MPRNSRPPANQLITNVGAATRSGDPLDSGARAAPIRLHDSRRARLPAYRQRPGYSQALVTLSDAKTGRRRDFWLGEFESAQSRQRYHRLIALWESLGRRFPPNDWDSPPTAEVAGLTISELVLAHFEWAKGYYQSRESDTIKVALRLLRNMYGESSAATFGPQKLRLLRETMIRGDHPAPPGSPGNPDEPVRAPWTRVYCNQQCRRIRAMFKWAASREMLPVSIYQALTTVEPLRKGRSSAREGKKVGPAPLELIDACRPFLNRHINALIDLQLLTGARSGELVIMRPVDLDTSRSDGVWLYRPARHKTEHFGKERVIYLGPKAREVVQPFLMGRRVDHYIFSPREAEAQRRADVTAARTTPQSCGNVVGSNRCAVPKRCAGDHYTTASYFVAIRRACEEAFPAPQHLSPRELGPGVFQSRRAMLLRMTPQEREELAAFRKANRWHPHQLRHNAGTYIRKEFGLEAAQLVLGHSSAEITDSVYAERDMSKVVEVMRKIG